MIRYNKIVYLIIILLDTLSYLEVTDHQCDKQPYFWMLVTVWQCHNLQQHSHSCTGVTGHICDQHPYFGLLITLWQLSQCADTQPHPYCAESLPLCSVITIVLTHHYCSITLPLCWHISTSSIYICSLQSVNTSCSSDFIISI